MARFVSSLQEEISRLARKEALKVEKPLKKAAATLRQENSALKRRVNALEKVVAKYQAASASEKQIKELPSDAEVKNVKIQPRSIAAMRKKHGLSALKMAALLGINHKSIARWEKGIGVPQTDSKKKLLAFKNMTKTEVKKMLNELDAKKAPVKKTVTKKAPAKKKVTRKKTAKK
jgi:DNA-binding transcriptional regulator YiaG